MASVKKYKYDIGDIIVTIDDKIGMICSQTNAYEYMAVEKNVAESLIRTYSNILIYKVIIDSTISLIQESNIRECVCRVKKDT